MVDNNIDIYKLVEEANKQKNKDNDLEEIYSMLDEVKTIDIEDIRKASSINNEKVSINEGKTYTSNVVHRPILPTDIGDYDSRYNCFVAYLMKVNYGDDNSFEYVNGHKDCLNRFMKMAESYPDDLHLVEASVNDELKNNSGSKSVYDKGYYDGLNYIRQALKKSKDMLMEKIYRTIKREL